MRFKTGRVCVCKWLHSIYWVKISKVTPHGIYGVYRCIHNDGSFQEELSKSPGYFDFLTMDGVLFYKD